MAELEAKNIGLRGVTVADSKISKVDGMEGKLIYRGYSIGDLSQSSSYSEVVFLLLMGRLPTADELAATEKTLAEARELPRSVLNMLEQHPREADPMDVLQSAVAALAFHDPDLRNPDRGARVRSALRLIARTTSVITAWYHIQQGNTPPLSLPTDSQAGAYLRMLWDRAPSSGEQDLMNILLVIHAEHTFNASTFAVREVASTQAHIYASVAAGVGALSGALHGGANARVMQMLEQIEATGDVEGWVRGRIEAGQRVMGLGHAVYKTEDPRARVLRDVAERVLRGTEMEKWFRLALAVEESSRRLLREIKGYDLYPNVDFYSGAVLRGIGFPNAFFPAFFATSRVAGWCAHYIEEEFAEAQPKPALYRPRANYTGRLCGPNGCQFVPVEARGVGCPCGKEFEACDEQTALEDLGWR